MEKKKRKIIVYTSSITGNTRKVMDHIAKYLEEMEEVERYDTSLWAANPFALPEADLHILGFWCRRGSMDDASLKLIDALEGENVLLMGTLGNYPDRPYGKHVIENVMEKAAKSHALGCFLCRGKIEESRTDKRRQLPKEHRHYLDDEGYLRHLESRSHPDEKDLEDALSFVKRHLESPDFK